MQAKGLQGMLAGAMLQWQSALAVIVKCRTPEYLSKRLEVYSACRIWLFQ